MAPKSKNVGFVVFSFGAVLWELIERRNPVHWTASAYTSNEEGLFVFPFDQNWPPALRNIVSFCLQPSPECRPEFQTIIELLNDEIKVLDSSDIDKTVTEPSQDMNKRETQPHLRGNKYSELAKGSMQLQEKVFSHFMLIHHHSFRTIFKQNKLLHNTIKSTNT